MADTLPKLLAAHSSFDPDAVLGLLTAVASSPAPIDGASWLVIVLPRAPAPLDQEALLVDRLFERYDEVCAALAEGAPLVPDPCRPAACASFARGYIAGIALYPPRLVRDRWVRAAWAAFLAGRLDLVPRHERWRWPALGEVQKCAFRREIGHYVVASFSQKLAS